MNKKIDYNKAPIGAGGKGVSKLDTGDDVEVFIKENGIQLPVLVEEYIEGDIVYTVETVSYNKTFYTSDIS